MTGSNRRNVQVANSVQSIDSRRSFARLSTSPGSAAAAATARSPTRTWPMKAAASTSCPWTSPIENPRAPSGSRNPSYQSPPMARPCLAGAYRAAVRSPGSSGSAAGRSSRCSASASSTRACCSSARSRAWAVSRPSSVSRSSALAGRMGRRRVIDPPRYGEVRAAARRCAAGPHPAGAPVRPDSRVPRPPRTEGPGPVEVLGAGGNPWGWRWWAKFPRPSYLRGGPAACRRPWPPAGGGSGQVSRPCRGPVRGRPTGRRGARCRPRRGSSRRRCPPRAAARP